MFWVDNFHIKTEPQKGTSSIKITHIVAFQEKIDLIRVRHEQISFPKRSKLDSRDVNNLAKDILISPKVEPPCIEHFNDR